MSDQTNERAFETHVEETLLCASGWRRRMRARAVAVCFYLHQR